MKRLLLIAALLTLPLLAWANSDPGISLAEESESSSSDELLCANAVAQKGDELLQDYVAFMEPFFQADRPSSEQVEYAVDYYRYISDTLRDTVDENTDFATDTLEEAHQAASICEDYLARYELMAEIMLQDYALKTSAGKESVYALDAMSALNEHFNEFYLEFHKTFPQSFTKMNSRLECFASDCIGS